MGKIVLVHDTKTLLLLWQVHNVLHVDMYMNKVENLMQIWFFFGLQCDILWNFKFIKVLSVFKYIISNKCLVVMVADFTVWWPRRRSGYLQLWDLYAFNL